MTDHPVRLVVTDDLHRSRLTVFFRFFTTIPHLLWAGLLGQAVGFIVFANWFVLLFRAQTPQSLHQFVAGYVRYVTQVEAYLFLAANPFPSFYLLSEGSYAVDLEVDPPARQNRWVTFFRFPLAIPAFIIVTTLYGGFGGGRSNYSVTTGLAGIATFFIWFVAMFRGRAPRGLRDAVCWGLGYSAQTTAYLFLLTDRYPHSSPATHLARSGEPFDPRFAKLVVTDDLRRSRLTVFFRLLLALPHIIWLLLWMILAYLAAFVNWFAALITGRAWSPLARFLGAFIRYQTHVGAFLWLVGNPFPGFVGKAGSYPIDVQFGPQERQSRWVTFFRGLLGLPAWMIGSTVASLTFTAGFLGWFAALVRGRMPDGLRDMGAYALGYNAQLNAYAFLLTDRYPYTGPVVEPPADTRLH